jgi:DnaJ domain
MNSIAEINDLRAKQANMITFGTPNQPTTMHPIGSEFSASHLNQDSPVSSDDGIPTTSVAIDTDGDVHMEDTAPRLGSHEEDPDQMQGVDSYRHFPLGTGDRSPQLCHPQVAVSSHDVNGDAKRRDHNQGNQDKSYTVEQAAAVERVLACSPEAFYSILDLNKALHPDAKTIKTSYRKLSLLTHPDKNGHERADDAFKSVSRAFGVLGDPARKSQYDLFGNKEGPCRRPFGEESGGTNARGDWGDEDIRPEDMFNMSPEDMFNMFCKMGGFDFHTNPDEDASSSDFGLSTNKTNTSANASTPSAAALKASGVSATPSTHDLDVTSTSRLMDPDASKLENGSPVEDTMTSLSVAERNHTSTTDASETTSVLSLVTAHSITIDTPVSMSPVGNQGNTADSTTAYSIQPSGILKVQEITEDTAARRSPTPTLGTSSVIASIRKDISPRLPSQSSDLHSLEQVTQHETTEDGSLSNRNLAVSPMQDASSTESPVEDTLTSTGDTLSRPSTVKGQSGESLPENSSDCNSTKHWLMPSGEMKNDLDRTSSTEDVGDIPKDQDAISCGDEVFEANEPTSSSAESAEIGPNNAQDFANIINKCSLTQNDTTAASVLHNDEVEQDRSSSPRFDGRDDGGLPVALSGDMLAGEVSQAAEASPDLRTSIQINLEASLKEGTGRIFKTPSLHTDNEERDDSRGSLANTEVPAKNPRKPNKKKANSKPGQKRKYLNDWDDEILESYDRPDNEDDGLLPFERDALREIKVKVCRVEDNLERGYSPNKVLNTEASKLSWKKIKELVGLRAKILKKIPLVDDLIKDKALQSCLRYIDRTLNNPNVCPVSVDESGKQTWREILKEEDEGMEELSDIKRFRAMRRIGVRTILQDSIKGTKITDNEVCVAIIILHGKVWLTGASLSRF